MTETLLPAAWIEETLGASFQPPWKGTASSVSIDSRHIAPGALFVGVNTPSGHRQTYTPQAHAAGAAAAIVEARQLTPLPQLVVPCSTAALQQLAQVRRQSYTGQVIGLSGSSGKTSTKELLAHLLGPNVYKTHGNLNNHLGVPLTLLHAPMTASAWVLEAGVSSPSEMAPLARIIAPNVAMLTMIGSAHLEKLKTRRGIGEEKSQLLEAVDEKGWIVIHRADTVFLPMEKLRGQTIILDDATETDGAAVLAAAVHQSLQLKEDPYGWQMTLGSDRPSYALPPWTPGMARNAALCVAVAKLLGVKPQQIQTQLESWPGVELRGQWLRYHGAPAQQRIYLDAYNSNPEALADSLWRFEKLSDKTQPRLFVVGTMGELGRESQALHRQVLEHVGAKGEDTVIFVGSQAELMQEAWLQQRPHTTQQDNKKINETKKIKMIQNVEEIKLALASWPGDCFIKGSHSTQLHTIAALCSLI